MEDNIMQKKEDMQELRRMLDTVANQDKAEIEKGKEELIDIRKFKGISFEVEQNGEKYTITKDIFEVLLEKDGEVWHEFYDDQGKLLASISDEKYLSFKTAIQMGNIETDENSLEYNILSKESEKSLQELEEEQSQLIADAIGMDREDIETLNIVQTNGLKTKDNKNSKELESKKEVAREKLKQFMALGIEVDTTELATSDDTIKESLQIDADKLLIVQVNGTWRALEIDDAGNMHIAKNLEIVDNKNPFNLIEEEGRTETKIPSIEFRRKDNPNISLAVDSNNRENKTQLYLIAGNSRTATELETEYTVSPYADEKNNELVQMAQEDPDKDPHEPDEPGERKPY